MDDYQQMFMLLFKKITLENSMKITQKTVKDQLQVLTLHSYNNCSQELL